MKKLKHQIELTKRALALDVADRIHDSNSLILHNQVLIMESLLEIKTEIAIEPLEGPG